MLKHDTLQARNTAKEAMLDVREAIGIWYFDLL